MAQENLSGGRGLIAGMVSTRQIPLAADTYYIGMRLEYNATNDDYEILSAGLLAAIYNGTDGRVLAAPGVDDCIVWGEISRSGIVDDAGDIATITEDEIALYRVAGFLVKEN